MKTTDLNTKYNLVANKKSSVRGNYWIMPGNVSPTMVSWVERKSKYGHFEKLTWYKNPAKGNT